MGWFDWVAGIATGGLYNVGKSIYDASEAAKKAGNKAGELADEAGTVLATAGAQIGRLTDSLTSFLEELEELVTIKRETPREDSDLWDEEVARLKALRQKEAELVAELNALGKEDEHRSWWDTIFSGIHMSFEELRINAKLAIIRAAIDEILYEEPGVIPTSLYHFKEILEQFSNTTLPIIEETISTTNANLEESSEILKEVKKLFVIKTFVAVGIETLPERDIKKMAEIQDRITHLDGLINLNSAISTQIKQSFPLIKEIGLKNQVSTALKINDTEVISDVSTGLFKAAKLKDSKITTKTFLDANKFVGKSISAGQRIGSMIKRDEMAGNIANYNATQGFVHFFERERIKLERELFRIKFVVHEEPGVIPKTLEEVRQIVQKFRVDEQPRIENIMDNVNGTIVEAKSMIANANSNSIKFMNLLHKYKLFIGIAVGISVGLFAYILLMSAIILTRMAFGI